METAAPAVRHFKALDGCRGICACLVALLHFNVYSHVRELPFVANAYLFVDFFFVLSGFVIAANYTRELREGFGIGRFMFLRWGRLYPLHLATLLVFVVLELLPILLPQYASRSFAPFETPGKEIGALILNFFMVQGLGFQDQLGWNFPSWSISAEFATYGMFALAVLVLPARWLPAFLVVVMLGLMAVLGIVNPRNMDATYNWGLARAVAGFAAGALAYFLFARFDLDRASAGLGAGVWTGIEVATVLAVFAFVSVAGITKLSLVAPIVFLGAVLVFAIERGAVGRLLRSPSMIAVGLLSYSIYMIHAPIQHFTIMAAKGLGRMLGADLFTTVDHEGEPLRALGLERWQGDLATLIMLVVVVALSALTYRYIETPGRRFARRIAEEGLSGAMRNRLEARGRPALP